jgi:hypothetical protein
VKEGKGRKTLKKELLAIGCDGTHL